MQHLDSSLTIKERETEKPLCEFFYTIRENETERETEKPFW